MNPIVHFMSHFVLAICFNCVAGIVAVFMSTNPVTKKIKLPEWVLVVVFLFMVAVCSTIRWCIKLFKLKPPPDDRPRSGILKATLTPRGPSQPIPEEDPWA